MNVATAGHELAEGDVVVINALDHRSLHLPRHSATPGLTLDKCVSRDGMLPSRWTGHCGVAGGTWHYREHLFGQTRRVCLECIRIGLDEAEANRAA